MQFYEVAKTFEQIEQESSRLKMTELLAELFKKATPEEAKVITNLSLGLLRPPYQGTQFNFAEKSFIKVLAELLDKSESTVQAHAKKVGDLGSVVAEGEWRVTHHPTITQVYDDLCDLEKISGTGSQEEKGKAIIKLLKGLDPVSGKYVVRIILGTLRLGFSDMTIVDALSWMEKGDKSLRGILENAYNICADIGLIAYTLKEKGIKAIEHMKIHVGIPIRPAAAERLPTAKAIIEKLGHCVAQPKIDGFRLQIHMKKKGKHPEVYFFSRNLQDMSHMFPDLVKEVIKIDAEELICEGEAIAYDEGTKTYLKFQETVKRKRKHGIEEAISDYPLHVYIFDLLYLDGDDYMEKTHTQRRAALEKLFKHSDTNVVSVIDEKKIDNAKDLEDYFHANIASGLEGLVVKKPDSIYQPGKRNFNWIKLKRQEEGHLEDTIDCVILGYYAGSGKRASFGVGAFLVGVYNKTNDTLQTIAKIGTGMTDAEWKDLKHRCDRIKVASKPARVDCAKELYPDVWVTPEIVCMVRADEITLSPLHTAHKTAEHQGYALRFPRFMGYRPDKSAQDATAVTEIKNMYKDQFSKK
jgi:DNA ligase-1